MFVATKRAIRKHFLKDNLNKSALKNKFFGLKVHAELINANSWESLLDILGLIQVRIISFSQNAQNFK